ncbi:hypothetical protein PVAP13_2NG633301 [Panicum virgatum]|uniref:Uncharacterized protein n=1 Tax=Panicum virgatum TaxID=38727 RepID=A0A8T0VVE1_PANVG|nr:hypothetical protein PVAP13_2NG633301 [Panicum virgatum]
MELAVQNATELVQRVSCKAVTHLYILIASLFQIEEAELSIMNLYADS